MTDDGPIGVRVVEALAAARDEDPVDVEVTVADYVDLSAIEALDDHDNDRWKVTFDTDGHRVRVSGTGEVEVTTHRPGD